VAEGAERPQTDSRDEGIVRRNTRIFARAAVLVAAALVVAFLVQILIDAVAPDRSLGEALRRPWTISAEELQPAIANISRTFNQLIAVVIMALAIAVPLTANMYTPKLLEIFLGDRVNRWVLGLFVFSTANTLWVAARVQGGHVPRFGLVLTFVLLLACFSVIVPYFFYVFRFLHPAHILDRLRQSASHLVQELPKLTRRGKITALQADLRDRIEYVTSLGMRSLDREDREVAQGALASMQNVMETYAGVKREIDEGWFKPRFKDAMGMSNEAMRALEASRTWVEMECLRQVELLFLSALAKASDLVGAACQVLREVGLRAARDGETPVLELATDFFHSFLRATINARDVRSAYHVLYQYRLLAEALLEDAPDTVGEMAQRLCYYAGVVVQAGLDFVAETIAYDLGTLCHKAHDRESAAFESVMGALASLPHKNLAGQPLKGVHKASLILAAQLELAQDARGAALLAPVKGLSHDVRAGVFSDLLDEPPQRFWEVTDRLVNFDYTPPELRAAIEHIKSRM